MAHKVKALQQWCKQQVEGYRDVNVTNMTSSWRSGLAFCALIHRYRPDLIDYDSLSKEDVYENNALAFKVAKESLDIPDLLEAEDMVAMAVPDKLCIVTYVSQYYNVLRSMTPGGDPSNRRTSPLKRPQTTAPPDAAQAKRITMETKAKDVQKTAPTARSTTKQSMGDKCHICHQKVYLMERHLEGGKLYHRHCFRESQKSSFRAYRTTQGIRKEDSKENISPTVSKSSSNGTTNGASARSMAKLWDTKIADNKRGPHASVTSLVTTPSTSGTASPALAENSRFQQPPPSSSSLSTAPDTNAAKLSSPKHQARPKTWNMESNLKPRTARPWSPPSNSAVQAVTSKPLSPASPTSTSSSASSSPSLSGRSLFQPRSFSPRSEPLSPSAEGLFPHFNSAGPARPIPAAPAEPMEVDDDLGSPRGAAAPVPTSPPSRPPPPSSPKYKTPPLKPASPSKSPTQKVEPKWKTDDALKSNLLASLSNIRQRYDTKTSNETGGATAAPTSTNSKQNTPESPKKLEQPRSILKSDEVSARGPKPILKHKDPVSFTDCDSTKPSDSRPLRSILKAGPEAETNTSSMETSPRSILKHHDEVNEDQSQRSASHSILKTDTCASVGDTAGDGLRRSILKTKDVSGVCDNEGSVHHEENASRPVRSILKSRKSSGDSLLSSSGDELDDLSPRPILKTSPRSENIASPTHEPRSILKTKNLPTYPSNDSPIDSPKPILKSRESSPTRSMSPMRVAEPVRPILKKGIESPTPILNPALQSAKSPTGPSVLKSQQSDTSPLNSSSFAAFKSSPAKNYTSPSLGLGSDKKSPPPNKDPVNNMSAFNMDDSITLAKQRTKEDDISKGRSLRPAPDQNLSVSQTNGAKKTDKSFGAVRSKEEKKPDWMIEAEKRQMARKGKYEDPEKVPVKRSEEIKEKTNSLASNVSKFPNGSGASDWRKTTNVGVPMETDDRPEWQKEAEKRQALRSGQYPDPEKGPVRPKDKPSKPPMPARPVSQLAAGAGSPGSPDNKPRTELKAPPKPVRSPLPQRAQNKDRPKTPIGSSVGKPEWQREAERRQAQRQLNGDQEDLQHKKKSPAPVRPPLPVQLEKKKRIQPDSNSNLDDQPDLGSPNGNSQYAEIGPPSRRINRGKTFQLPGDRESKFANRPLPPVPADQDLDAPPKRRVNAEARLSNHTILRRLEDLDLQLQAMEQEGRGLEEKIRSESDDAMDEADLMIAWFELVNKKNDLVRKESDLMYRQRQQELEEQHEELEYELRCLMDKTDKTPSEKIREDALLKELVETVMLRNNIVDSIEEDRIRYLEEDQEIAVMMEAKGFSLKDDPPSESDSPKKRNSKDKKKDQKKKEKHRRMVKSCVN